MFKIYNLSKNERENEKEREKSVCYLLVQDFVSAFVCRLYVCNDRKDTRVFLLEQSSSLKFL